MTFSPIMTTPSLLSLPSPSNHNPFLHHKNHSQPIFTDKNHTPKREPISIRNHPNKPIEPIVTWTSTISKHCRQGQLLQAFSDFTRMRVAQIDPNRVTFLTLLSGCTQFPSKTSGLAASLHGYICKLGLDRNDVMVGTALVRMYAKHGSIESAQLVFEFMRVKNSISWNTMIDGLMRNDKVMNAIKVFDEMPQRDAISWTALINGFIKKGHYEEALDWFREMQSSEKVKPDYVTIIAVLDACTNLGSIGIGFWIHAYIFKQKLSHNVRISNSLIDMYSRCGCIEFAHQVFDQMQRRTLVSWNSIIIGFAVNGFAEKALSFFNSMQEEGLNPDEVSFTGALTACSHGGLVNEGLRYFDIMTRVYKISPRIEHYGCIVDLYSRAGKLEDALNVIETMPMKPNEVVVGSLLAACRNRGNISLGERLMKYLVGLDSRNDSNYVLLANMYAEVGRWDGANDVRRTMKELGITKKPGFSAVEIGCDVHEFVAGDRSHVDSEQIYETLRILSVDCFLVGFDPENVVYGND